MKEPLEAAARGGTAFREGGPLGGNTWDPAGHHLPSERSSSNRADKAASRRVLRTAEPRPNRRSRHCDHLELLSIPAILYLKHRRNRVKQTTAATDGAARQGFLLIHS